MEAQTTAHSRREGRVQEGQAGFGEASGLWAVCAKMLLLHCREPGRGGGGGATVVVALALELSAWEETPLESTNRQCHRILP